MEFATQIIVFFTAVFGLFGLDALQKKTSRLQGNDWVGQ